MSNKIDIFMPIIWGDYEKKTSTLSILEHGAYLLLLKEYWNNGGPIECECNSNASIEHMRFYRSCRAMTTEEQKAIDYVLGKFFTYIDGKYHQSRADDELAKAREKRSKARDAAEKRWKKEPSKDDANAYANALPTHMLEACSTQSPSPSHIKETGKGREGGFVRTEISEFIRKSCELTNLQDPSLHMPDGFYEFFEGDDLELKKLWGGFVKYHIKQETRKSGDFWLVAWKEHLQRNKDGFNG